MLGTAVIAIGYDSGNWKTLDRSRESVVTRGIRGSIIIYEAGNIVIVEWRFRSNRSQRTVVSRDTVSLRRAEQRRLTRTAAMGREGFAEVG